MAKRFKNFREDAYDNEWGDKNEDRRRERSKNRDKKMKRRRRRDEKVFNFKEFNDQYQLTFTFDCVRIAQ